MVHDSKQSSNLYLLQFECFLSLLALLQKVNKNGFLKTFQGDYCIDFFYFRGKTRMVTEQPFLETLKGLYKHCLISFTPIMGTHFLNISGEKRKVLRRLIAQVLC